MDPSRLLETTQVGLERELLRSADDEVMPAAVRARVLASLAGVLVASVAPPAAAASGAAATGSAGASVAAPGVSTKLALALKSIHAVYLSGAVAVAAGSAVVLQHLPEPASSRLESRTSAGHTAADRSRSVVAPLADAPLQAPTSAEPPSAPAAQGPLACTSSGAQHRSASIPSSSRQFRRAVAEPKEEEPDWLGAQFELLGETRAYLESGRLDQAGSLLDGYEQRFPGGVIAPQIAGLRAALRERRTAVDPLP